jgi:hypothetical protein
VKAVHWPGLLTVFLKVAHNGLRKMDRSSKRSLMRDVERRQAPHMPPNHGIQRTALRAAADAKR